ncbi:MAG: biotin--[acetyl-CoA-carboxylase] ligase [Calditrichaeota bacterium]|nr:biotin--[acetyl-CoA-carboxylase] ligase [Calditrichota bacterium]MCB9368393.1 biotin--[acetyl-CoA-carboxylase] ligase [Calditrichota bacterium]
MSWDEKQLHWHLATRRFGRQIKYFDEIDSTNRWLLQNHSEFTLTGGVVVAGHQTIGKGRNSRSWSDTPNGSVLCSLMLKVKNESTMRGFLSILPAVALARVIRKHDSSAEVSLKWPNDVLLSHKKLAGVLAETTSSGEWDIIVVGVGINLTAAPAAEFGWPATSLHDASAWKPAHEVLLAELLNEWEPLFDLYQDREFEAIRSAWTEFGPRRGARVKRVDAAQEIVGEFEGLGDAGQLLLRDGTGVLREIYSGDILPA